MYGVFFGGENSFLVGFYMVKVSFELFYIIFGKVMMVFVFYCFDVFNLFFKVSL